jgi:hypothetical protein
MAGEMSNDAMIKAQRMSSGQSSAVGMDVIARCFRWIVKWQGSIIPKVPSNMKVCMQKEK